MTSIDMSDASRDVLDFERMSSPPTRPELFSVLSHFLGICTIQQRALRSLRESNVDNFEKEYNQADEELDKLYDQINQFIGFRQHER